LADASVKKVTFGSIDGSEPSMYETTDAFGRPIKVWIYDIHFDEEDQYGYEWNVQGAFFVQGKYYEQVPEDLKIVTSSIKVQNPCFYDGCPPQTLFGGGGEIRANGTGAGGIDTMGGTGSSGGGAGTLSTTGNKDLAGQVMDPPVIKPLPEVKPEIQANVTPAAYFPTAIQSSAPKGKKRAVTTKDGRTKLSKKLLNVKE
jgi:hypothetical protein